MTGFLKFFSRRAEEPIEQRDYGRLYLVLSILLFVGTMWSVIDEISTRRPWKEFQESYFALSAQRWGDRLKEAEAAVDSASVHDVDSQMVAADNVLSSPAAVAMKKEINDIEEN